MNKIYVMMVAAWAASVAPAQSPPSSGTAPGSTSYKQAVEDDFKKVHILIQQNSENDEQRTVAIAAAFQRVNARIDILVSTIKIYESQGDRSLSASDQAQLNALRQQFADLKGGLVEVREEIRLASESNRKLNEIVLKLFTQIDNDRKSRENPPSAPPKAPSPPPSDPPAPAAPKIVSQVRVECYKQQLVQHINHYHAVNVVDHYHLVTTYSDGRVERSGPIR